MVSNNPTLNALATYPGSYKKELFARFFNSLDVVQDTTLYPNIKDKQILTKLKVNDTPRPLTGTFAPADDDIDYAERVIQVDEAQRDVEINPRKYKPTWMAEMQGAGSGSDQKTIPFAAYTWQTVVGEQAAAINDRTAWRGRGKAAFTAYSAGTAYAVGDLIIYSDTRRVNYYRAVAITTAGQSPVTHPAKWENWNAEAITKGLGQIIKDEITAATLSPVVTGAITSSSGAYDQFMEVWRNLSDPYRAKGAVLYCSYTDFDLLVDDYEDKVGKFNQTDSNINYLPKTDKKCVVKPCTWMINTRRLFCTPKANVITGTDRLSDMETITTIPTHYSVEASIAFQIGFQFRDLDGLAVSDQV